MAEPYEQISPTAKLVAEMRRYSDVPFAEAIAREIRSAEALAPALGGAPFSPGVLCWMAPMIEARYKSLARAIERSGAPQVLELASGFTFRGAVMASPARRYIESDLPAVHAERMRLRADLEARGVIAPNPDWICAPADVSRAEDLARVVALLDPAAPVAVVHEGLLQYLDMDEKRGVARAIGDLLARSGGVWLTPDFEALDDALHQHYRDPQFRTIGEFLVRSTKRDLRGAAFQTRADVHAFCRELGFTASEAPQLDGSFELASVARAGTTEDQLAKMRASRVVWTLRRSRTE